MTPPLAGGVIDETTTGETVQFHAANTIAESDHTGATIATQDGTGRRADTATTRHAGATSRRRSATIVIATVTMCVRDALDETASHRRARSLVVAALVHHATSRRRAAIIMIATRVGARNALDASTSHRPARSLVVAPLARRAATGKLHHGIFIIATTTTRNVLDATTTRARAVMGNDTLATTAKNQVGARHHQQRHHASNKSSGVN